jgi:hypothetical protein
VSLSEATKAARAKADCSTDPWDHRIALALEGVLAAEARGQLDELAPEPDLTGIPPWSECSLEGTVEQGPFPPGPGYPDPAS